MAKVTLVLRDASDGRVSVEAKSRPTVKEGVPLTPAQAMAVSVVNGIARWIALGREKNESESSSTPSAGTPQQP